MNFDNNGNKSVFNSKCISGISHGRGTGTPRFSKMADVMAFFKKYVKQGRCWWVKMYYVPGGYEAPSKQLLLFRTLTQILKNHGNSH